VFILLELARIPIRGLDKPVRTCVLGIVLGPLASRPHRSTNRSNEVPVLVRVPFWCEVLLTAGSSASVALETDVDKSPIWRLAFPGPQDNCGGRTNIQNSSIKVNKLQELIDQVIRMDLEAQAFVSRLRPSASAPQVGAEG
jgi:hypothetical protein